MPSTLFITKTFENWSREESRQTEAIESGLDQLAPVEAMRIGLLHLVRITDLWDDHITALQVTGVTRGSVRTRAVVSATNSGRLFELRYTLREQLINWSQTQAVYALPCIHLEPDIATALPQKQRQDFVGQVKID